MEHYKSSHSTAIDRAIDANRYRPTKAGFGGKYKMAPPKYNQTTRPIMTQVGILFLSEDICSHNK